ncbi:hypothetical protein GCM10027615_44730 [Plantactinospora veratri]
MSDPSISATLRDQTLNLLASGEATSRADLVEALQVAPSTVTGVVRRLLEEGAILEEGVGRSTGGRRPRILRLREPSGVFAVAELGARHARVGLSTPNGRLLATEEVAIDIAAGPGEVFEVVGTAFDRLRTAAAPGQALLGIGAAMPGPVEFPGAGWSAPPGCRAGAASTPRPNSGPASTYRWWSTTTPRRRRSASTSPGAGTPAT